MAGGDGGGTGNDLTQLGACHHSAGILQTRLSSHFQHIHLEYPYCWVKGNSSVFTSLGEYYRIYMSKVVRSLSWLQRKRHVI